MNHHATLTPPQLEEFKRTRAAHRKTNNEHRDQIPSPPVDDLDPSSKHTSVTVFRKWYAGQDGREPVARCPFVQRIVSWVGILRSDLQVDRLAIVVVDKDEGVDQCREGQESAENREDKPGGVEDSGSL